MPFYAFRLNGLQAVNQRSSHADQDVDVLTFQVLLNDALIGQGAFTYAGIKSGDIVTLVNPPSANFQFTPLAPTTRKNISPDWIVGPIEVKPGDLVRIIYAGVNQGDLSTEPDQSTQRLHRDPCFGRVLRGHDRRGRRRGGGSRCRRGVRKRLWGPWKGVRHISNSARSGRHTVGEGWLREL